jgi:DNA replication and repair protein RecF
VEIGTLSVEAFRNLAPSRLGFHPRMNLLVGSNGQGKTNVLESLALVSGRPSFRTADLSDVVRDGAPEASVSVRLSGAPDGALGARLGRGRREHAWNGRKVSRMEASRRLPLVLLTAADLTRLGGPPAERRRALDRVVLAFEPGLAVEYRRSEKARAERVALLTAPGRPDRDALSSYEEILAASGAAIADARRRRIGPLGRRIAADALLLDAPWSDVSLRLVSDLPPGEGRAGLAEALGAGLRAFETVDRRAGRALFGPHRDDVRLVSGGIPLSSRASSGEMRTLVLAWTLAERALLAEATGVVPVFAFDDFDSEWDPSVLARFARTLPDDGQVFLTSARATVARALPLPEGAVWNVDCGSLSRGGRLDGRGPTVSPAAGWPHERSEDVLAS